ncbi:MAG: hypothetical protein IJM37_04145 [Lachnospiraceae bacterium]|nr:hypothetical protein [Lachnospiraceae bacterium]
MKKNIKTLCLALLCVVMVLSACGKTDSEFNNNDFSWKNMQLGYDAQPYFTSIIQDFVKTEDGYHYFDRTSENANKILMFFDKHLKKAVPVCNKANCSHFSDDIECDAVFEATEPVNCLTYYDKNLYSCIDTFDSNEAVYKTCIYRISPDGSKREKFIDLFSGNIEGISVFYHRGYAYAALNVGNDKLEFYKTKLEKGAKPELIKSFDGYDITFYDFSPYKNGIAFIYMGFQDSNYEEIDNKILYYNPETGEISELLKDIHADSFRVVDDCIYYTNGKTLYEYDMVSNTQKELYGFDNNVFLSFDGKYIYGDTRVSGLDDISKHYVYVLDTNGKLVDSISIPSDFLCYFGDEDYLFQLVDMDNDFNMLDESVIKAFDKSQIGTGKHEWIVLPGH